jgi:organic radical activating enzyme
VAVVPVPRDLDLHLTARIARERYGAQLSVGYTEGSELVVLTGDEGVGRRSLDLGRLVTHLASVHEWIEALSDEDHVARLRVRAPVAPGNLDDVIAEIAMGRVVRRSLTQTANLVEIFSSVQGEGPHVGQSTLFVRFGECDLRCRWCDSPHTWLAAKECRVELRRGGGAHRVLPNPVAIEDAIAACEALELPAHRFVSLTGGEPLLQPEAVAALARGLRGRGPRILLETHGAARRSSGDRAIDVVRWTGSRSDVRRSRIPATATLPFTPPTSGFWSRGARPRWWWLVRIGSEDAETTPLRIAADPGDGHPAGHASAGREAPSAERLLRVFLRLSRVLPDVRLIPQTHKLIGVP